VTLTRTIPAAIIAAALAAVLAGCAADTPVDTGLSAAKGAKTIRLSIVGPRDGTSIRVRTLRLSGHVTRGATVRVNGKPAAVAGRRFSARVSLRLGRNKVRVTASKAGYVTKRRMLTVTRKRKPVPAPAPTPAPTPTPTPTPEPSCHPNYAGACLDPNSYDYDCEGGSGDGPDYTGTVRVVGDDPFDLDRDGDGIACDP
jgi:hypothetical protein